VGQLMNVVMIAPLLIDPYFRRLLGVPPSLEKAFIGLSKSAIRLQSTNQSPPKKQTRNSGRWVSTLMDSSNA